MKINLKNAKKKKRVKDTSWNKKVHGLRWIYKKWTKVRYFRT